MLRLLDYGCIALTMCVFGRKWQVVTGLQNKKVPNISFPARNGGLRRVCKRPWRGRAALQKAVGGLRRVCKRPAREPLANPSQAAMERRIIRERLPPDLQTRRTFSGMRFPFSSPHLAACHSRPVSTVAMRAAAVMVLRFGQREAAFANPVCDFADAGGLPT